MGSRVLLFLVVFTGSCFAQVTGRLSGSVVDASGAPVPNAEVNLLLAGGSKPVLSTQTTSEGLFSFTNIRPESYDLTIESKGFVKYTLRGVKVDPGRETSLPHAQLELPAVTQAVDVVADAQTVQTSNAEIATTVTNQQVRRLPMLDRDPVSLITTQPGVAVSGNNDVVINGTRSSFTNVTLDGINIQDNFIRANGLTYQPNLLMLDQVSEFTISTSNTNASVGGGSSQITLTTPSGSNTFHGAGYAYNRNNALAAGNWFDNKDSIPRAFLNQWQLGTSLGGRIIKDKLFFYTNYEAFRNRQKTSQDRTILTADARQGIFTYVDTQGRVQKRNILQIAGETLDPTIQKLISQIPGPEKINNFRSGDSSLSLLRNTAGYSFAQRDNRTRDNFTVRGDYNLSPKHAFSTSYIYNRDLTDRGDINDTVTDSDTPNGFSVDPAVTNDNHTHFLSSSWRWNPGARFVNEVRGGFNLAPGDFINSQKFGSYLVRGTVFSNPVNPVQNQGRATNTFNLADNATYIRGRHTVQFGFQSQYIRISLHDFAGTTPTYDLTFGDGHDGLSARDLPGISGATDLDRANQLLATLAGWVDSYSQNFNVASRTSGYVTGAPFLRHYSFDNYAGYIHDSWKISRRLTATLGLRYEYFTVLNERDALELIPRIQGNVVSTLLSDATLDFAGKSVGRPFYNPDRNNFAPNIGIAWDVFGNGKTSFRAGYSVHFVNDETIGSILNDIESPNQGLYTSSADFGLSDSLRTLPAVAKPDYQIPRKQSDNYLLDPTSALGIPDPNLRTPYVQAWSIGLQHEFKGTIFDLRYVGNHGTKSFRAFDYNQVLIKENGFLDEFKRAYNNGNLARTATGTFDPRYNPSIPGSQRLPIFDQISLADFGITRGGLTNSFIRGLVEQGQAGELAYQYQVNGFSSPIPFFRNPVVLGADTITNFSNSTYNSLQFEVRRRMSSGLNFQGSYTFSKVLSDAGGTEYQRFEPFLDVANPKIERARSPFDLTHSIKTNWIYELPFGKGHRISSRLLNPLLSGWSLSSIMTVQSGAPFSVFSSRGTLNRLSRSTNNTAITTLTGDQLDNVIGFRMTGDGPYMFASSVIGPDGRAVAADGAKPFTGQAFFNPGPGEIGSLQRRMFSGPWTFDMDAGLQKLTHITERQTIEFRIEAGNVLNHPNFYATDFNINSTQFGRIVNTFTSTLTDRRVIQFGLYYRY